MVKLENGEGIAIIKEEVEVGVQILWKKKIFKFKGINKEREKFLRMRFLIYTDKKGLKIYECVGCLRKEI